jgi:hypothetical protein
MQTNHFVTAARRSLLFMMGGLISLSISRLGHIVVHSGNDFPALKTGISVVNKVELADVIGTGESETAKERCLRYPLIPTSMNRAVASILSTYASGLGTHTP